MSSNIYIYSKNDGQLHEFGVQSLPVFKEDKSIEWVINGVQKDWYNRQPDYYNYLFQTSSKNNAIINSKSEYIYGKGWDIIELGLDKKTSFVELASFLKKVERTQDTQKMILDREIQGGFACEIIYSEDSKMIFPNHVDFGRVRVSKPEYDDEKNLLPEKYYYTSDWSKGKKSKDNPDFVEFLPFDWDEKNPDLTKRYLIYFKDYRPDLGAYPFPLYMGGVPYIDADSEVGNFVKNNVKNGFNGAYLVNFYNGTPDDEQKAQIVKDLNNSFSGTDNAGQVVASFNENKDSGVEITPLSANGQDDRYIALNDQIRDEIFTAHRTSPLVVGMKGENGFSNNADEIRTAVESFTEGYVKPRQQPFNLLMNNIIHYNEIQGSVYLERLDPIQVELSETTLLQVATLDEIRAIAGLGKSKVTQNPVLTALQSLSPLVQNKILDSLNVMEIRNLIELKTEETGVTNTTVIKSKQFSKFEDDSIVEHFASCGTEDLKLHCFDNSELYATDIYDAQNQAHKFKQKFASKIESAILSYLLNDPKLTVKDIAKLLNDTPKNIGDVIKGMEADGLIEGTTPTEKGKQASEENEIFVVYKYDLRLDAPPLVEGGKSREFCIKMRELSKTRSWTIEDIQSISNRVGYDVFTRRGGWYHNPLTEKNTPFCRDIFYQRLVRNK